MKTIKLFAIGLVLFLASTGQAQVSVTVNVGSPPMWGPAGYAGVSYYYLPDVEAYYDVQSSMFIYYTGGVWIERTYLPYRYRNYDLYSGYKVVMHDYHGHTPYIYHKDYQKKYKKGYHGEAQKTIGVRPGNGHYKARYHSSENGNYDNNKNKGDDNNKKKNKDQKHDNGKGKK